MSEYQAYTGKVYSQIILKGIVWCQVEAWRSIGFIWLWDGTHLKKGQDRYPAT